MEKIRLKANLVFFSFNPVRQCAVHSLAEAHVSPTEAATISDVGNGAIDISTKIGFSSLLHGNDDKQVYEKSVSRGEMPPKKGKKGGKKQDDDWGEDDKKVICFRFLKPQTV